MRHDYDALRDAFELVETGLRRGDYRYRASLPCGDLELLWCKIGGEWYLAVDGGKAGRTLLKNTTAVVRIAAAGRIADLIHAIREARSIRTDSINDAIDALTTIADGLDESVPTNDVPESNRLHYEAMARIYRSGESGPGSGQ